MNMESTCDLINKVMSVDSLGFPTATETKTTVFCKITSISQTEYYSAGKAGIIPEYRFSVNAIEYDGQKELEYDGKRYGIYRTYLYNDEMDLYAEYKGGMSDG